MKKILLLCLLNVAHSNIFAQASKQAAIQPAQAVQIVEAACGQCMFKLKGDDCDLAVRIKDKAYFVDGSKIDDHGDAHADDGFCNKIRKAAVTGKLVNDRFVATSFKLLPVEKHSLKD